MRLSISLDFPFIKMYNYDSMDYLSARKVLSGV